MKSYDLYGKRYGKLTDLTADIDTLLPLNFLLENEDGHKLHFFKVQENHYRGKIFHKAKTKTRQAMSKQERESQ